LNPCCAFAQKRTNPWRPTLLDSTTWAPIRFGMYNPLDPCTIVQSSSSIFACQSLDTLAWSRFSGTAIRRRHLTYLLRTKVLCARSSHCGEIRGAPPVDPSSAGGRERLGAGDARHERPLDFAAEAQVKFTRVPPHGHSFLPMFLPCPAPYTQRVRGRAHFTENSDFPLADGVRVHSLSGWTMFPSMLVARSATNRALRRFFDSVAPITNPPRTLCYSSAIGILTPSRTCTITGGPTS